MVTNFTCLVKPLSRLLPAEVTVSQQVVSSVFLKILHRFLCILIPTSTHCFVNRWLYKIKREDRGELNNEEMVRKKLPSGFRLFIVILTFVTG